MREIIPLQRTRPQANMSAVENGSDPIDKKEYGGVQTPIVRASIPPKRYPKNRVPTTVNNTKDDCKEIAQVRSIHLAVWLLRERSGMSESSLSDRGDFLTICCSNLL